VDISGDLAVVSAPFNRQSTSTNDRFGSVYVYDLQTGSELYRLIDDEADSTYIPLALSGTTLVKEKHLYSDRGGIEVFDAPSGQLLWTYGYSQTGSRFDVTNVDIDGNLIAVGLGHGISNIPTVVLLDRTNGTFVSSVDTSIVNLNDSYKREIDLSGNKLIVGSWGAYDPLVGQMVGETTIFDIYSNEKIVSLKSGHVQTNGNFGYALAIEGSRVVVTAPGEDGGQGNVYTFLIPEPSSLVLIAIAFLAINARSSSNRD
jgi:outer membrane protein assembly factor BamB